MWCCLKLVKTMFKFIIAVLILSLYINEHCISAKRWLKEGQPCMDGSRNGTCKRIRDCKVKTHHSFSDNPKCSKIGSEPVICCANLLPVRHAYRTNVITDPLEGVKLNKTGRKAWDKCLDYLRDVNYSCKRHSQSGHRKSISGLNILKNKKSIRNNYKTINNGKRAKRTQFPHMALLGYDNELRGMEWLCGGTLISERFVLTAGQCTYYESQPVSQIALGILKRSDPPEWWKKYRVSKIIKHPDYHPPQIYNDIALLKTAERVTFSFTITPACLAVDDPPYKRKSMIIERPSTVGWGKLGAGNKVADTLQVINLEKLSFDFCQEIYPIHRNMPFGINNITQVCYGDKKGIRDTCQGDGGGPLQIFGQASYCQYSVIAIISYGAVCPAKAGLYTNILPYLPWIESIVWP